MYGSRLSRSVAAAVSFVAGIVVAEPAAAQNWTGPIWDFQSRTCHDSGTCDSGMGSDGVFRVCAAVAPDLLAERILYALGALNLCHGYTDANYRAFLSDVPPAQQYAVNYLNYGFGEPLLSASEAQALEARDFPRMAMLPGAPPVPGGGKGAAEAASQVVPADELGACDLPYANEAQRREQEIYAKYGDCRTLTAGRR